MKTRNLSLCIGILFYAISCVSQVPEMKSPSPQEGYLYKSKQQKSAGWTLLGLGTGIMAGGLIYATHPGADIGESVIGGLFVSVGVLCDLGSIGYFISASKYKKRAMNAVTYIKMQEVPIELRNISSQTHLPTATVKFTF